MLTWLHNSTLLLPTGTVNTRGYGEAVVGFIVILGTLSQTKRASRANERKRRQLYRGEVHGQLPFDTKGMEDPVPTIDFSPTGGKDHAYSLEREDVDCRCTFGP